MTDQPIAEGDILAYTEGESRPQVEALLRTSPTFQQEVEAVRNLWTLFQREASQSTVPLPPDPQDLVDVVTGQATPLQQLRVAAYVRTNPAGRAELAALEAEFRGPSRRSWLPRLPRLLATPLAAFGTRSGTRRLPLRLSPEVPKQSFFITHLQIEIAVAIVTEPDDYWTVRGQCTQDHQGQPDQTITLLARGIPIRRQRTDAEGYFTFRHLRAGHYKVRADLDQGSIFTPAIQIGTMD